MSEIILRGAELRALESRHAADQPPLMERAGAAAAEVAAAMLTGAGAPPLIVCGPGNNGGDGHVVARLLKEGGYAPLVVVAGAAEIPERRYGLAIDALFGIGLTRDIAGRHAALVEHINALGCPVLSLDIPSGLDSETGRIRGTAVRATRTATFIALKPGLLTADGPDCCGAISVHDLGLTITAATGRVAGADCCAIHLRPRLRNSHKGAFGSAAILGGAPGMAGAALLAGRAALKLGAGRVYLGMLERLAVDPAQPELMLRDPADALAHATALAVGPGLGQSRAALDLVRRAVGADLPLLLDADALNLLAAHPVLLKQLQRRTAATLLTPHPAEAARLLGTTTAAVQGDRLAAAQELAKRCTAHVVLKGCGSVVAAPPEQGPGRWWINTTGNAGLASAGTGDVLTGIVVALLAQGWPAPDALLAGVHLHGAAADALVAQGTGPVGIAAGELIDPAREIFNRWIADA